MGSSFRPKTCVASVVICTRDRRALLAATLDVVCGLEEPLGGLELLVVDNGSSDGSEAEVALRARSSVPTLRWVREPRVGLSHARNRAVAEARGAVLLFLDDDARPLRPDWALRLLEAFADPQVGVAGGDLVADWPDGAAPDWLPAELHPPLGIHVRGGKTPAGPLRYPFGANFAVRRSALRAVGGFRPELGWAGPRLVPGEDTELCVRLERAGYRVAYVADAVVRHEVVRAKLCEDFLFARASGQGTADACIDRLHSPPTQRGARLARRVVQLLWHAGRARALGLLGAQPQALVSRYRAREARAYLRNWRGDG